MNTKEYGWKDIKIVANGVVIKATNVSYNPAQEKEYLHASGSEPNSIQAGNRTYEGSLSMLQSSLDALKAATGVNHAIDIPGFTMIVAYGPTADGRPIQADKLQGVEIDSSEKSMSQNDKNMEVELPIKALKIIENTVV